MLTNLDFKAAQQLLMDNVAPIGTEQIPLSFCANRILAANLTAVENIPPFDRSPYDGYAFQSADTQQATNQSPVTLTVLEEVPASSVPTQTVTTGTATKILTGAPIPQGADVVCKYEDTSFSESTVTLFQAYQTGDNIVTAGEDVKLVQVLAQKGDVIDAGTLSSQGTAQPLVYRKLRIGILSTGNEVIETEQALSPGKIRNSNRHTFETVLERTRFEPVYLGLAGNNVETICKLME